MTNGNLSNVTGYMVNIQKIIVFLCTNIIQLEIKILKLYNLQQHQNLKINLIYARAKLPKGF